MSPTYEQNKKHIYKWRQTHLEQARAICRKNKAKYDAWKKVQKMYLAILLDT